MPGSGAELDVPHAACVGQVRGLHARPLVAEWAGRSSPTRCSCLLGSSPALHDWDMFGKELDGTQDLTGMASDLPAAALPAKTCGAKREGELALKASWM